MRGDRARQCGPVAKRGAPAAAGLRRFWHRPKAAVPLGARQASPCR